MTSCFQFQWILENYKNTYTNNNILIKPGSFTYSSSVLHEQYELWNKNRPERVNKNNN